MTVLVIRKHSRFAVCRRGTVTAPAAGDSDALLIELSLEGCRIGNVDASAYPSGSRATFELDGHPPLTGEVRWCGEGSIGLRLSPALHTFELDRLVRLCRGELDEPARLRA